MFIPFYLKKNIKSTSKFTSGQLVTVKIPKRSKISILPERGGSLINVATGNLRTAYEKISFHEASSSHYADAHLKHEFEFSQSYASVRRACITLQ